MSGEEIERRLGVTLPRNPDGTLAALKCDWERGQLRYKRQFVTIETFNVTGRGTAHSVYVGDIAPELGEDVLLDGKPCRITGVEWPIRKGFTSILVAVY